MIYAYYGVSWINKLNLRTLKLILLYSSSISAFDPFLLYTKLTEYSVNEPVLESIVVGCTVQTNELLLAGKVYFVQMVLDDLSMTAVLTQPSKSWVGPHLALNQSLNLWFFLLGIFHTLEHYFSLLYSLWIIVHFLHDLQRVFLILFIIALVIKLVVAKCHISETVSHEGIFLPK